MTATSDKRRNIAVIGLGNVLLSDDGFGPFVVEELRANWDFPDGVTLIDAGTPGLGLTTLLAEYEIAILIDTIGAAGSPGELRQYSGDELQALPLKPRVSPHDPAVQETLWITELAGRAPREVALIGVIPLSTEVATKLSPPVRASAATAARLVIAELMKYGVSPLRRPEPRAPEAWWALTKQE